MPRRLPTSAFLLIISICLMASSRPQPQAAKPQTARQALLEMMSGGDQAFAKHLTVEIQEGMKNSANGKNISPAFAVLGGLRTLQTSGAETFETGSVLLSMSDPKTHEKFEVHVDSDDLSGDEDRLQLSIHAFRDGQEIDSPLQFISRIEVGMRNQRNIWRLNEITVSATVPVGDPVLMAKLGAATAGGGMIGGKVPVVSAEHEQRRPKLDVANTIRMLGYAEASYASMHPDTGFSCSLAELMSETRDVVGAMGVDPALSSGTWNGYRFSLSGCQGTPAGSFQIAAEPITPSAGAKAFCSDATHNIRISEDGKAATCILLGKPESSSRTLHVESHIERKSQ